MRCAPKRMSPNFESFCTLPLELNAAPVSERAEKLILLLLAPDQRPSSVVKMPCHVLRLIFASSELNSVLDLFCSALAPSGMKLYVRSTRPLPAERPTPAAKALTAGCFQPRPPTRPDGGQCPSQL